MYKFTIPPVNGTNTTQSLINIVKEERIQKKRKKFDIISFLYSELKNSIIDERGSLKIFKLYICSVFQGC